MCHVIASFPFHNEMRIKLTAVLVFSLGLIFPKFHAKPRLRPGLLTHRS